MNFGRFRTAKMTLSNLRLGFAFSSLLIATGCGYGGGLILPHPTGNYSNASLKGQYVYQLRGSFQSGLYRESGVWVADGAGNIVSPSIDDFSATSLVTSSVSGTYTIAKDGTGFVTLHSTGLGQAVGASSITLALTLVSPQKAYLIEADSFADAGGVAELEDPSATGSVPSGTFVFRLHQFSPAAQGALNTSAEVGVITISAQGAVTNGTMDQNLNGTSSSLTLTGSLSPPQTLGQGSGSFTDSSGASTRLVYQIENAGKIVFLVGGGGSVGSGSAELQTGAVGNGFSGNYAFLSRGDDASVDGVETVGQFSGSGATISSGLFDSMQDGNYTSASFTGSPTISSGNPSSQGRVQVTLTSGEVEDFWMVNPARAFFLSQSPSKVEDGTADLETGSSFSTSSFKGQFALVMDGIDVLPENLARAGTLSFDGVNRLTLVELVNASSTGAGATSPGALGGNYQVGMNGRILGNLANPGGALNLVMYAVSPSAAYTLQIDSGTNTSGTLELQH